MSKKTITADLLRELLHYSPDSGLFTWRENRSRMAKVGAIAGARTVRGYWSIGICGRQYLAHRLAWLYMTGNWPISDIDHRDVNKINNSWLNLREVSEHENLQNQRRPHRNNKVGLLGVSKMSPNSWQTRIRINGKEKYLGSYRTPDEAHQVYVAAKRKHHPGSTL